MRTSETFRAEPANEAWRARLKSQARGVCQGVTYGGLEAHIASLGKALQYRLLRWRRQNREFSAH